MSRERQSWVDVAKGIGILLVVYGHVVRGVLDAGVTAPVGILRVVDSIIYSFHMPLFFFLSGLFFVTTISRKGVGGLLWSKIDSLLYPYLVWSVLQGAAEVAFAGRTNIGANWSEVFSLWLPRAQFWFLYSLFLIFFLMSIVHRALDRYMPFVFLVSFLGYVCDDILVGVVPWHHVSANALFFICGVIYATSSCSALVDDSWKRMGWLFLSVIVHTAVSLSGAYSDLSRTPLGFLVAMVSVLATISLVHSLSPKAATVFAYFGSASMVIYLLHIFFGSGSRVLLRSVGAPDSFALYGLVGIFSAVAGPMLVAELAKLVRFPYLVSAPLSGAFKRWVGHPA